MENIYAYHLSCIGHGKVTVVYSGNASMVATCLNVISWIATFFFYFIRRKIGDNNIHKKLFQGRGTKMFLS